ncbi:MAG: nicotinate phosphoribosyltransferase [Deltaproteobacteria bacterium]|nr:nicotinate phosphoribosyltransferase [Deltaproteobacteria bacterium]
MSRAMFTDLYALTMGASYIREGRADRMVSCEMFTRRLPRNRRFMVVAGMREVAEALADWRFTEEDLRYLRAVPVLAKIWTPAVEERLAALRFTGDVSAMADGTVFFPDEPVLRVTAPVLEAQLLETYLLSVFNQAASVASKAARLRLAAGDGTLVEFGMRRVHPDASVSASLAAAMLGFEATSNVAAGQRFGLNLTGTMAHAFVMVHDSEIEAFRAQARLFGQNVTLLVDTYDTLRGVERAMEAAGPALGGVRLDSGDLLQLSRGARALLDSRGFQRVKIVASGDLEETRVAALRAARAPIDVYAVGTELSASADAPTLGAVYKVTQDHAAGRGVAKFSANKGTLAGVHQVYRRVDGGRMVEDVIGLEGERMDGLRPLLRPLVERGRAVGNPPALADTRAHALAGLAELTDTLKDLGAEPQPAFPVRMSAGVKQATEEARARLAAR